MDQMYPGRSLVVARSAKNSGGRFCLSGESTMLRFFKLFLWSQLFFFADTALLSTSHCTKVALQQLTTVNLPAVQKSIALRLAWTCLRHCGVFAGTLVLCVSLLYIS